MTTYAFNDRGSLEVITENFYDAEILRVFGTLSYGPEQSFTGTAFLVPEPDNPCDPRSIAVRVGQHQVGHFAKDDAARYWPAVTRVVASGFSPTVPVTIKASLVDADGTAQVQATTRIQIAPPALLFPINAAPARSTVLPQGPSIKVLDEQAHVDYLHAILPESGEARLFLTLEVNQVRNAHGEVSERVEVLHERNVVGRFSTQLSAQFIPVIRHAFEHDRLTAVWATIRGSAYEVSLTVQAARPEALDAGWYKQLPHQKHQLVAEAENYDVPDAYVPTEAQRHAQKWPRGKTVVTSVWALTIATALLVVSGLLFLGREPLVTALALIVAVSTGVMAVYLMVLFGLFQFLKSAPSRTQTQPTTAPPE